jgi:hypothetical protein
VGRAEPATGLKLPNKVVLITCGCPLRQSYDARMPDDYTWLWEPGANAPDLRPVTLAWINAYRPRDYIGQAMFHPPLAPDTQTQGTVLEAPKAGAVDRLDVCLNGTGSHVGYWTDLELAKWVDYALDRCLGGPDPGYPDGYELATAEAASAPTAPAALQP